MKVSFLKRLESSVKSFEITMERTIAKIEDLENKIARFQASCRPTTKKSTLTELAFDDLEDDEAEGALWKSAAKFKYKLAHLEARRLAQGSEA